MAQYYCQLELRQKISILTNYKTALIAHCASRRTCFPPFTYQVGTVHITLENQCAQVCLLGICLNIYTD